MGIWDIDRQTLRCDILYENFHCQSQALEEARVLREELEQQQQQGGHQQEEQREEPDDLLQRLQLLSHENREYKRKLVGDAIFKLFSWGPFSLFSISHPS